MNAFDTLGILREGLSQTDGLLSVLTIKRFQSIPAVGLDGKRDSFFMESKRWLYRRIGHSLALCSIYSTRSRRISLLIFFDPLHSTEDAPLQLFFAPSLHMSRRHIGT